MLQRRWGEQDSYADLTSRGRFFFSLEARRGLGPEDASVISSEDQRSKRAGFIAGSPQERHVALAMCRQSDSSELRARFLPAGAVQVSKKKAKGSKLSLTTVILPSWGDLPDARSSQN